MGDKCKMNESIAQYKDPLVIKVTQNIERYDLIKTGETVLVGLSGGADSVVLTHVLHQLAKEKHFRLVAVHVNHMLRGDEAEADAIWVAGFCEQLGIPLHQFKEEVQVYANKHKVSFEQAGRLVRQKCFKEVGSLYSDVVIATGHHKNDLVETFFMNLFRGAGVYGLSSMSPYREDGKIKPLLSVGREEIEGYVKRWQLEFRHDHTNDENEYSRNKIRNECLPMLRKEIAPALDDIVFQTAQRMRMERDYWTQIIEKNFSQYYHVIEAQKCVMIERTRYNRHEKLEQFYMIRGALELLLGSTKDIYYTHIDAITRLSETGKSINLGHGAVAFLTSDALYLAKEDSDYLSKPISGTLVQRKVNKPYELEMGEIAIDADALKGQLSWRYRIEGDRFVPMGMNGFKKLKDFFIDQKIPRQKRDQIPIIHDEEKIIWVYGYRQDDRTKVTERTENILIIAIR